MVKGATRRLCFDCRKVDAMERYYKYEPSDECSLCSSKKPYSRARYCAPCNYNKRNKIDFKEMDSDFLIDVSLLIKRIDRCGGNLKYEDIFKIVMWWCDCSLWPHKYNAIETTGGQVLLMYDDLKRLLRDENVDHKVRKKGGRSVGSKNKKKDES